MFLFGMAHLATPAEGLNHHKAGGLTQFTFSAMPWEVMLLNGTGIKEFFPISDIFSCR